MDKWIKEYFKEKWENVETDIDFNKHNPISTSHSLHIYEERYIVDNETYRLLYLIGNDADPNIEKLIEE